MKAAEEPRAKPPKKAAPAPPVAKREPPTSPPAPPLPKPVTPPPAAAWQATDVLLGFRLEAGTEGAPVRIPIVDLTRHTMIRAAAGSGKTVLIKRLIEESALSGIPSIVIDTAKDLSFLGDPWPEPPKEGWSKDDTARAAQYHRDVDVKIWTPGHAGGCPLHLAPLPNLSGPFEEEYDRDQVIQLAVAGLVPLAIQRRKPVIETAILRRVVEWLTRQPQSSGNELERLASVLRDLPGETFQGYQNERKLAAGMADQIQANLVNDPLYQGRGDDLDPAVLFGVASSRPRISILSFVGMDDFAVQVPVRRPALQPSIQLDSQESRARRALRPAVS